MQSNEEAEAVLREAYGGVDDQIIGDPRGLLEYVGPQKKSGVKADIRRLE